MVVFSKPLHRYAGYSAVGALAILGYQYAMNKNTHYSSNRYDNKDKSEHDTAFFNLTDTVRSVLFAVRSPQVRNLALLAAVLTFLTRRLLNPLMPINLRKRALVPGYFIVGWALYYRIFIIEKPVVRYSSTYWNTQIAERIRRRHFAPCPWLFNTHSQTAVCNLLNSFDMVFYPHHTYTREAIPAFDGNDILLDWAIPPNKRDFLLPESPVVIIFHGIMGNCEDNYMRNIASQCLKRGWRAVVLFRWRIDIFDHRDIQYALNHIRKRYPVAPLFGVGFSAGGNYLLSYLTQVGEDTPLTAAVCASTAWDYPEVMRYAQESRNKSYYFALNYASQQVVLRHLEHDKHLRKEQYEHVLKEWWDKQDGHGLVDNFVNCLPYHTNKGKNAPPMPLHAKYGNPTDGYWGSGPPGKLHKVKITTMVVHAMDDPIGNEFTQQCLEECVKSKHIIVVTTKRGGHIGWHEGAFPTGPSWCDKLCTSFISSVLAAHAQANFTLDMVKRTLLDQKEDIPSWPLSSAEMSRAISSSNIADLSTPGEEEMESDD